MAAMAVGRTAHLRRHPTRSQERGRHALHPNHDHLNKTVAGNRQAQALTSRPQPKSRSKFHLDIVWNSHGWRHAKLRR